MSELATGVGDPEAPIDRDPEPVALGYPGRDLVRLRFAVSGPANRSSGAALRSSVSRTKCRFSLSTPPLQERKADRFSKISAVIF